MIEKQNIFDPNNRKGEISPVIPLFDPLLFAHEVQVRGASQGRKSGAQVRGASP